MKNILYKTIFILVIMSLSVISTDMLLYAADFDPKPSQNPTPPSLPSHVETQLRLNIQKETDEVHFISTNNDPYVYTKVYVLKHADPYELRPYLRSAVRSRRVNTDDTWVECIKYNDGTSMLLVSAEEYRFDRDQNGGMGLDQIVELLDQPKISSSSGSATYAYFPKYCNANVLYQELVNCALNVKGDVSELEFGKDLTGVDNGLNALIIYVPRYQVKNVNEMVKMYDVPSPEVRVKYSVYELDSENDGKMGLDFQAWKNGPGNDIFSAAGRFTRNWGNTMDSGPIKTNSNYTKFVKFSPRWNSRYVDFLAAKGKAKVITSGELSIMNRQEGVIVNKTEVPVIADGEKIPDKKYSTSYIVIENKDFWQEGAVAAAGTRNDYKIKAYSESGALITTSDFTGSVSITKVEVGPVPTYYVKIQSPTGSVIYDGRKEGDSITCYDLKLYQCQRTREIAGVDPTNGGGTGAVVYADSYSWVDITSSSWQDDGGVTIQKDYTRETIGTSYGFALSMIPEVNSENTILKVAMSNSSLIGFNNDGTARTSTSEVNTQVMVSNTGNQFFIGGLEKKTVVKSVSKIPWLGSLPLVGWALGNDAETTKVTQLLAIIECVPVRPDTSVGAEIMDETGRVRKALKNAGETNNFKDPNYGYDQFLFDNEKDKKGLDAAP